MVRVQTQAQVAAPLAAVWAWMTQGKNLATWCPQWKSPTNVKVSITKVGDVLDYTDEWGNGGRSIVTYLVKGKELRVAHEPNKGDYMCQAKFILEPVGTGTRVHMWDQYTDESSATDMQATAQKMDVELARTLAALKRGGVTGIDIAIHHPGRLRHLVTFGANSSPEGLNPAAS